MCLGAHLLQASGFDHGETLPTNVIGQPDPNVASRSSPCAARNALCWGCSCEAVLAVLPKMCASAPAARTGVGAEFP